MVSGEASIVGIYHHGLTTFTCYVGWHHHTSIVDCRTHQEKLCTAIGRCQVVFFQQISWIVAHTTSNRRNANVETLPEKKKHTHLLSAFQEVLTCLVVWDHSPLEEMLAFPILKKNFANPGSDGWGELDDS